MVFFKNWLTHRSSASPSTYHLNLTVDRSDFWFNVVSFMVWQNARDSSPLVPDPPAPSAPPAADLQGQVAALQAQNAALEEKLRVAEQARHQSQGYVFLGENQTLSVDALFLAMDDLVLVRDAQGRCTQILTPQAQHLLYRPAAEILGKTLAETFAPAVADRLWNCLQQVLQTQQMARAEFSLEIQGRTFWLDARISPLAMDAVLWVVRDISDRKRLETEHQQTKVALQDLNYQLEQRVQQRTAAWERSQFTLRQHEQEFRTLVENAPDPILRLDPEFRYSYVNPTAAALMGLASTDIIGKTSLELGFAPDLVDLWESAMTQTRLTQQEQQLEYNLSFAGELHYFQSRVAPEFAEDGRLAFILVIIRDITTLKQTEAALRLSQERLHLALTAANMGVWHVNLSTGAQIWSLESQALFGFAPGEFAGNHAQFMQRVHPEDHSYVRQQVDQAIETGVYEAQYRVLLPDQTIRWIASQGRVMPPLAVGEPLTMNGVDWDISDRQRQAAERQRTEAALQQSEHLFRTVFDNAPIAISLAHVENCRFLRVNAAHRHLFGYSDAEIETMTFIDFSHPDDIAADIAQTQQLQQSDRATFQMEKRFIHKSGRLIWTRMTASLIRDCQGQPLYSIAMLEDITARKQTEDALCQSEEQFRRLFELAPLPIGLVHLESYRFLDSNAAHVEVMGYSREELRQLSLMDISHPDDLAADLAGMQQLVDGVIPRYCMEKRLFRKNGEMLDGMLTAAVMRDAAGTPLFCMGLIEDITERKLAEAQLRTSLQEKEVLLKEIHHRVKNNLQIISSLLRMQSRQIQDPQTSQLFQESQNRVQSMALIHEQLYQAPDLSEIDFAQYVQQLVHNLFRSYGVSSQDIALDISTQDICLTLNTAIPCGLIINELVSNTLKYAFPAPSDRPLRPVGKITIALRAIASTIPDRPTQITLIVQDNGIGIAPQVDWQQSQSLGWRIVRNLVTQLQGSIRLPPTPGTCFYITFPNLER